MKKTLMTVLAMAVVALGVFAQNSSKAPESKSSQYDAASGVLYEMDTETLEAVIKDWASMVQGQVYSQTKLPVPDYFEVKYDEDNYSLERVTIHHEVAHLTTDGLYALLAASAEGEQAHDCYH